MFGSTFLSSGEEYYIRKSQALTIWNKLGQVGAAVAIDYPYIIIGAPGTDGTADYGGSVYFGNMVNRTWTNFTNQTDVLVHNYGSSVDVQASNNTAVIGSPRDGGDDRGAIYIYVNTNGTWARQAYFSPADLTSFAYFGTSVSISGETVVVGAWGNGASAEGAVYVYTRSGTAWSLQQKITYTGSSFLGRSVSINGDTLVVSGDIGTISKVLVYTRSGTTWSLQQQFGSFAVSPNGVSVVGDVLLVGDMNYNNSNGAVYFYTRSGTTWSLQQTITGSSQWGSGVQLDKYDNNRAVVCDEYGYTVYYIRSGTTWGVDRVLFAGDTTLPDPFQASCCTTGRYSAVGIPVINDVMTYSDIWEKV